MRRIILSSVFLFLLFCSVFSFLPGPSLASGLKISPPPLLSTHFSSGDIDGRYEASYITFENINGYGIQRTRRKAHSDLLAITSNIGFFYLSGDQKYENPDDGKTVEHDIDYYFFLPLGISGELQYKISEPVNLIIFGGPRFHYGHSEDETLYGGTLTSSTNNDYGLGGEIGIQLGIKVGRFMVTPFASFDSIRIKSTSSDDDTEDQYFTFDSQTVGIDILDKKNGLTLSALVGTPEHDDNDELDDFTIIKLGWMF